MFPLSRFATSLPCPTWGGPADSSLDFAAIASEVLLLAGMAAEAVEEAEDNEKKEEIIQNFENKMLSLSQDVFR